MAVVAKNQFSVRHKAGQQRQAKTLGRMLTKLMPELGSTNLYRWHSGFPHLYESSTSQLVPQNIGSVTGHQNH